MSRIYHIVNYLGYLAGFCCVLMIGMAVFKILTGDEMEYRKYLTRIRNGLIALVLVLTISTTKNLVLTYFPYVESSDAIGDFSTLQATLTDGTLEKEANDKKGRWTISIDGDLYVKTGVKKINFGSFLNSWKKDVDVFKTYDECQGITSGSVAEEKYYMYWTEYNGKNVGLLISPSLKGSIHNDDEFKELVLNPWINSGCESQYEHIAN
ncbi:MAG: hypothetical protein E7310_04865 [Clostridiales bacterium]|nr:hypothetical protein [Clostridiales bacterium]